MEAVGTRAAGRRHRRHALGACAGAVLLPFAARAQGLEQLKVFYGFPPGSAGDITGSLVVKYGRAGHWMLGSGVRVK